MTENETHTNPEAPPMISFRWKILAAVLAFSLIPMLLLNRDAVDYFDRFTRAIWEHHMVDAAWVAGARFREGRTRPDQTAESEALRRFLSDFSRQSRIRLKLLDAQGTVFCDSQQGAREGDAYALRPEVVRALSGRYGARAALTPDRQYMYYYCALPVFDHDGLIAVAYASRHTSPIINAIRGMVDAQRRMMWRTALAALPACVLLAYSMTARLRRLARASDRVARGLPAGALSDRGHDEISRLARAFRQMLADVDRRNQRYKTFAGTLFHELKTPLSAMRGAVEILRQSPPPTDADRERFLGNIASETHRMDNMVSALRDLSRFETDRESDRVSIDQAAETERILERLQPGWPEAGAPIGFRRLDAGPFFSAWVPGRLEQVLANLLDNALRHTPPDGAITVEIAREHQTIVTQVSDSGHGIAPADLDRVFERFFTTARQDPQGGSGLGLAVVKTIIEHHHGQVGVHSLPGQGSRFTFRVPAASP